MLKKYGGTIGILFLFFFTSITLAEEYASEKMPPVIPTRVGGTLTLLDVTQITNINCKEIGSDSTLFEKFKIEVKRPDGTSYSGANTSELNEYDQYVIDIPLLKDGVDVDGAVPGDKAVIHVYDKDGLEFQVKSPYHGEIIVGEEGDTNQIDLLVQKICVTPCTDSQPKLYTQEELDAAVKEERQKWDANNDQHIGLEEAIRALQILSGVRSHPGR